MQAGASTNLGKEKTPASGILVAVIKGAVNIPWIHAMMDESQRNG